MRPREDIKAGNSLLTTESKTWSKNTVKAKQSSDQQQTGISKQEQEKAKSRKSVKEITKAWQWERLELNRKTNQSVKL